MNDTEIYTADELARIEDDFIRHLVDLGGWRTDKPQMLFTGERQIWDRWLADGRLQRATKERVSVVELTAAGWAWCREHGIG
ncbi:hypothetical protein [Dactylosporangium sp. CA-139066]|uniref:hypothetical protein n=1 Tax=Dactylosporangium sp. CA-139066 TaxID=3239930 RepID=UPI003D93B64D